jgi:hypothetical protein
VRVRESLGILFDERNRFQGVRHTIARNFASLAGSSKTKGMSTRRHPLLAVAVILTVFLLIAGGVVEKVVAGAMESTHGGEVRRQVCRLFSVRGGEEESGGPFTTSIQRKVEYYLQCPAVNRYL